MRCTLCGHEKMFCECHPEDEVIRHLRARISLLEAALQKYGQHLDDCDATNWYGTEIEGQHALGPCNCGLKEVLP